MTVPKMFIKASQSGQAHASAGEWAAPRLSAALLKAVPGTDPRYRTDLERAVNSPSSDSGHKASISLRDPARAKFVAELKDLCGHLRSRLEGSLDEAWMSEQGYNPDSQDFKDLVFKARKSGKTLTDEAATGSAELVEAAKFYDSGEEQWARAFCEMALFVMYHTPGQVYGTPGVDKPWFDRFPDVYSISMTCQTLSTYGLLTRGIKHIGSNGLGCTSGSAKGPAFDKTEVKPMIADPAKATEEKLKKQKKITDESSAADKSAAIAKELPRAQLHTPSWGNVKGLVNLGATPGSVVVFNGGGSGYSGQNWPVGTTHIASLLRVSGNRIQFVDTGVVTGTGEDSAEAGTVDHSFSTSGINSSDSIVAFGVAKKVDDAKLVECAKLLATSKPLGLTRLVVATSDKRVLFVSKLLHMRWSVPKLIWSLRGLTGAPSSASVAPTQGLIVAWLVLAPHAKSSSEALAQALVGTPASPATIIKGKVSLTNVVVTAANGGARVFRSHHFSDWRTESGAKATTPGDVAKWRVGDGKDSSGLLSWAEKQENFDKSYVRTMAQDDAGSSSTDAIGDSLVDV